MRAPIREDAVSAGTLLIHDIPAELAVSDAFGHADYSRTLAELLTHAPSPFTVGVFGPWGQGKSSVIDGIAKYLPADVVLVTFDAWRHEGHALRRHFLSSITTQLTNTGTLKKRHAKRILSHLDSDATAARPAFVRAWSHALYAIVPALLLAALVIALISFVGNQSLPDTVQTAPWAAVSAAVGFSAFSLSAIAMIFANGQISTTLKRLDEPDRFSAKFEELLTYAHVDRLVVAIDNLDRCSPDLALETLATVKTYLETTILQAQSRDRWYLPWKRRPPAKGAFVVAVDDAALRRHLVAIEANASDRIFRLPQASNDGGGTETERNRIDAIGSYVDEYLRKFFGLTIVIRDLLDDDIREYARQLLKPSLTYWNKQAGRETTDTEVKRTAETITFTLGRNPRRIKQFMNSFTGRMQLIIERERPSPTGQQRIAPAISGQVHTVLLLALMEERWPEQHQVLATDPHALDNWHNWASWELTPERVSEAIDQETDHPDEFDPWVISRHDWPEFAEFLRMVDRPPPEVNLGAFFSLKQTALEARLPQLNALYDRVREARWDEAESIVLEDRDLGVDYVRQLGDRMESELRAGYGRAAVQNVRAVLKMPRVLAAYPETVGSLLTRAFNVGGPLGEELMRTAPVDVFSALRFLDPPDARSLIRRVFANLEFAGQETRNPWFAGLSRTIDELPEAARTLVVEIVARKTAGESRFWGLFDMQPTLVPEAYGEQIINRLAQLIIDAPPESNLEARDHWIGRAVLCMDQLRIWATGHDVSARMAKQICETVDDWLTATTPDPDHVGAILDTAARIVDQLAPLDGDAADALSRALSRTWDDGGEERRIRTLALLVSLAEAAGSSPGWQTPWRNRLRGDGVSAVLTFAEKHPDLRGPVADLTVAAFSALPNLKNSDPDHLARADAWLRTRKTAP